MQAGIAYLHGSVQLVTEEKGKKLKEPKWLLRYRLPSGKDSTKILGKAWLKKSRPPGGCLTKAQAESLAQQFLDEHADSMPEDRLTFGRACDDFLARCEREKHRRGTTTHEYRRLARKLCERPWRGEQTWRERPLDSFEAADLIRVRRDLLDAGKSPSTLNQHRCVIRGAFGKRPVAQAWEWVAVRRHTSEGDIDGRFYTPEQMEKLCEHAKDARDAAIFVLAAEAGLRKSEILGLNVRSLDFDGRVIRVRAGYTEKGGHAGTKSHKVRTVPMSDNVRDRLLPFCRGRQEDELVFHEAGQPISGSALWRRFKAALKRARLHEIRFHELRHTFGTVMAAAGTDIITLQHWMGHADISTTQIYTHYRPRPDDAAKISAAFQTGEVVPLRRAS